MLKNIAFILTISLLSTVACVKSAVETNAANKSVAEAQSTDGSAKTTNSTEKNTEKTVADNPNAKIFRGFINGAAFEMNLLREGDKLSGTYFYAKVGKDLKLSGTIDASGKFQMKETDASGKATGDWSGTWKEEKNDNGITLEGLWKKPSQREGESLSFYAIQQIIEFTNGVKIVDKTIKETDKAKRSELQSIYPEITSSDSASAKKFNELVKSRVVAANNEYRGFLAEMTDEDIKSLSPGISLSNEVSYDVALANNDFISLTLNNYTFTGGAHGGTSSSTINYDLKNNRELALADIFEPNSNYLKVISDYSIADLSKRLTDMSDEEWIGRGAGAEADNFASWNLTKKGLMFTFDQYQVAAYAAGPQTVIIPYNDLKSVLRKDALPAGLLK
jgi:Protein of unknown function (DUF3298)/Deacetylase PdaC